MSLTVYLPHEMVFAESWTQEREMLLKHGIAVSAGIVGALLFAALPARASSYTFDYTFTSTNSPYTLVGAFTTDTNSVAVPAAGEPGFEITNMTGTLYLSGVAQDTVSGLFPPNPFPNTNTTCCFIYDDAFFVTQPYLDNPGVLFATLGLPGIQWNLFSDSPTLYELMNNNSPALDVLGTLTIAETPIPAALPLFATGLGALGLLGWRRRRKNVSALAAA
jgi:hypothetical protein